MARKQKLKVYRTPIGFHDAYVAAPSQKAALTLWGVDVDLFARGFAEQVDDEALTRQPLEAPGTVVRVPRGTSAEHMAALPKTAPAKRPPAPSARDDGPTPRPRGAGAARHGARGAASPSPTPRSPAAAEKPPAKPRSKPRPSRAPLDRAEHALDRARTDHDAAIARIRQQEQALQQKRRDLETRHGAEMAKLETALDRARERHAAALDRWRTET